MCVACVFVCLLTRVVVFSPKKLCDVYIHTRQQVMPKPVRDNTQESSAAVPGGEGVDTWLCVARLIIQISEYMSPCLRSFLRAGLESEWWINKLQTEKLVRAECGVIITNI